MKSKGEDPTSLRFRNVNILNTQNEVETLDKPDIMDVSTANQKQKEDLYN